MPPRILVVTNTNIKKLNVSILGSGWLGLALGKHLAEKGYSVKASSTRAEKLPRISALGIEPFLLKIGINASESQWSDLLFSSEALVVVVPPDRKNPDLVIQYPALMETIRAMALAGKVQRILFVSSTGVYGKAEGVIRESDTPLPDTESARAIEAAENIFFKSDIPAIVLRMAGLAGYDRKAGRFLAGKTGLRDPEQPVNLVHRDDCIQAIEKVLMSRRPSLCYNVCSDLHPARRDFYTKEALALGLEPPVFINETTHKAYPLISNDKIKRELGFVCQYPDPYRFL